MGAEPYTYFVPYQRDFQQALEKLRQREFEEGRYNPVIFAQIEIIDEHAERGPGRQHETIEEALAAAAVDGTRSILDIESVGDAANCGVARKMTEEELEDYFDTTTPTRAQVLKSLPTHQIERGQALCLPVFDDEGLPVAICFMGYSYD